MHIHIPITRRPKLRCLQLSALVLGLAPLADPCRLMRPHR
jgi:hypothetical protein